MYRVRFGATTLIPHSDLSHDAREDDSRSAWAAAIVVVESLVLILAADTWIFGIAAAIAVLVAFLLRRASIHFPLNSSWVLGLACLCVVKLVVAPVEIPPDAQFIRSQFAHELARFLIITQILMLLSRDFPRGKASLFCQLGWVVLILSCDVRVPVSRLALLQLALTTAIILNGLFGMSLRHAVLRTRRFSWVRISVVVSTVLASLAVGTVMADAILRYERQLEWMVSNYLFPERNQFSSTGFSGQGRLDSITVWQKFESNEIVLQAVCDERPGYVVGRRFDTLETHRRGLEWSTTEPSQEVRPTLRSLVSIEQPDFLAPLFGNPSEETSRWTSHEFWSQTNSLLLLPLETELIAVHAERLIYSDGSHAATDRVESGELHYLAYTPSPSMRVRLTDEERVRYLQPHVDLDPQATLLAEEIFANAHTTDEKCRAVVDYLRTNFEYSRSVRRPPDADQISDFLLNNRQGHCEYFATAATLLLRLGGVPTRYVTGYVMEEMNPADGSWLARNKDAHAWAIAYDDRLQQWRVVEATPASGIPEVGEFSWWEERREALSLAWRRWLSQVREIGLLPSVGFYLSEHWLIPLVAVLSAVGLTIMIRRWSRSSSEDEIQGAATPAPWRKLLKRLDRMARRRGFQREEAETLQAFAARIQHAGLESIADAYREYARIRYSDCGEQHVAQLRQRVHQLKPV